MSSPVYLTVVSATAAFRAWLDQALPAISEVIYAKPTLADAPRPTRPYVTVERTMHEDLASHYLRVGDQLDEPEGDEDELTHELERTRVKQITVQVVVYANGSTSYLESLSTSRNTETNVNYLRTAGISAHPIGEIVDASILRDTINEPSEIQDWAVFYTFRGLDTCGLIESADVIGHTGIPVEPVGD